MCVISFSKNALGVEKFLSKTVYVPAGDWYQLFHLKLTAKINGAIYVTVLSKDGNQFVSIVDHLKNTIVLHLNELTNLCRMISDEESGVITNGKKAIKLRNYGFNIHISTRTKEATNVIKINSKYFWYKLQMVLLELNSLLYSRLDRSSNKQIVDSLCLFYKLNATLSTDSTNKLDQLKKSAEHLSIFFQIKVNTDVVNIPELSSASETSNFFEIYRSNIHKCIDFLLSK